MSSTAPVTLKKQDCRLKASSLELDKANNTGEAYNVTLAFKGVPFLYLPYLNFPLEGRKSGFLSPSIGRTEVAGNDIRIPFYWNIAPEYDATITARPIAARGNMWMTEGRYLAPDDSTGMLNVHWMPDDKLYGDRRLHTAFAHHPKGGSGWGLDLTHNYVSDPFFFNDMTTDARRNPRPKPEEIMLAFKSEFEGLLKQETALAPEKRKELQALFQQVQSSKGQTETARAQRIAFAKLSFLLELLQYYENQNTEAPEGVFAQRLPALIEQLVIGGAQESLDEKPIAQAEALLAHIISPDHRSTQVFWRASGAS